MSKVGAPSISLHLSRPPELVLAPPLSVLLLAQKVFLARAKQRPNCQGRGASLYRDERGVEYFPSLFALSYIPFISTLHFPVPGIPGVSKDAARCWYS